MQLYEEEIKSHQQSGVHVHVGGTFGHRYSYMYGITGSMHIVLAYSGMAVPRSFIFRLYMYM